MKEKKVPMRMCVGCREMKPKKELLRVVKSPEGAEGTGSVIADAYEDYDVTLPDDEIE